MTEIHNLKPISSKAHEEKKSQLEGEIREELSYISGEYLSAASSMVAWQFIDTPPEEAPDNLINFATRCADLMRFHCPIAYSYFFQNNTQDWPLPVGTLDVVLKNIRKERPLFLGGPNGDNNFFD